MRAANILLANEDVVQASGCMQIFHQRPLLHDGHNLLCYTVLLKGVDLPPTIASTAYKTQTQIEETSGPNGHEDSFFARRTLHSLRIAITSLRVKSVVCLLLKLLD